MITDPVLGRIGEAVAVHHHQGRPEDARRLFDQIRAGLDQLTRQLTDPHSIG